VKDNPDVADLWNVLLQPEMGNAGLTGGLAWMTGVNLRRPQTLHSLPPSTGVEIPAAILGSHP